MWSGAGPKFEKNAYYKGNLVDLDYFVGGQKLKVETICP